MRNLKFVFALLISLIAFSAVAPRAEAAVRVTVRNNRSHIISVAFCWSGFDGPDGTSKGWYNVKPGESRTITLADAIYVFTASQFGFYAMGTPKGGKTIYWRGKESDEGSNL